VLFRARAHLARREFIEAEALVRQVVAAEPRAVWPRVLLSHVLLQEGRDLDAAEQALRDVLALDPVHAEAQNNLAVLLRNRALTAGNHVFGAAAATHPAAPEEVHDPFVVVEDAETPRGQQPEAADKGGGITGPGRDRPLLLSVG
jgi:Flp pilus assembly protein TadD